MLPADFALARTLPPPGSSIQQAEQYTRRLATHHYENFTIATYLLPRELRQHFYNVYAYCRWADDLGDEIADPGTALQLLNWWQAELEKCYERRSDHPVFIALRDTIDRFDIPINPFSDLLVAFRRDQTTNRYPTWDAVLDYCQYSANPVGRLVLYVCGYRDSKRQHLSDCTCTALQLANFWQDVSRDLAKGRIYIPQDALKAFDLTESDLRARRFDARYERMMRNLIERTRELFRLGRPLASLLQPRLRIDIELFRRGGLAVLDAIESIGYNTLEHRPSLNRAKKLQLVISSVLEALPRHRPFVRRHLM